MGILEDAESTAIEKHPNNWGKTKQMNDRRAAQAMMEKERGRHPWQGVCCFCDKWHEHIYATVVDLCTVCTLDLYRKAGTHQMWFKILKGKPNVDLAAPYNQRGHIKLKDVCQKCPRKTFRMNIVNLRICHPCIKKLVRRYG